MFTMKVVVCVIVFLTCHIQAQPPQGTCQVFTAAPLSQCQSVVDYQVFVPINKTIADLDAIAGPKTGPFRLGITSPECNKYAMQFICAEVFHPCRNLPSAAGPVPIPIPTCKRRCERFVEACGQYLRDFNSTVPNCNSINPATNQSTYPEILMQLKLPSGAILPLKCNDPGIAPTWAQIPQASCFGKLSAAITPLSKCHTVIDYDVYLPDSLTIADLDYRASASNGLARTASISALCANATMRFVCSEAFRRCTYGTVNPNLPQVLLPSSTCYENCWAFRELCSEELTNLSRSTGAFSFTPPNCEATSANLAGQPAYPLTNSTFKFPTANVSIPVPCTYPSVNQQFAARCEPFRGYPEECRHVVNWNVFIPINSTQEKLAAQARIQVAKIQAAPTSCRDPSLRLACSSIFLRCYEHEVNAAATIKVPQFACRSLCLDAKIPCENKTEAIVNCDALTPTGLELYPETQYRTTTPDGRILETPCHVPEYIKGYPVVKHCPYPFVRTPDEELVCKTQCPTPVFTEDEMLARMIVVTILGYLGFFLGIFTFISTTLHPLKRVFPKCVINYQVLAASLMVIAFLTAHWVWDGGPAYRGLWCTDAATRATASHVPCGVESFFIYVFSFSMILWYFFVALFMIRAVLEQHFGPKWNRIVHVGLHILCWGLPLTIWICAVSTSTITTVGLFPCFLDTTLWERQYVEIFFWYPVSILLLTGLAMCTVATVIVIKKLGRVGFRKQIRVILYLIYNFCANIWIVFYHFYLDGRRSGFEDATTWWYKCSATSIEPCDPHGTIEYSLYIIQAIVYSSQPLCLALILLTDSEIWYWWRDVIRKYIFREDIDDRIEALQRVKAIQKQIKDNKHTRSDGTSTHSVSDWGADN